jgi:hypothetical protein
MDSHAFRNRIEIVFYSTLISTLSGINHLRAQIQHVFKFTIQPSINSETDLAQLNDQTFERSLIYTLKYLQQFLVPLLVWVILGFAAGFLIGMIKLR